MHSFNQRMPEMRILEKTLQRGMLGETFRGETIRRTKKDNFQDKKYGCLNAVSFRISL